MPTSSSFEVSDYASKEHERLPAAVVCRVLQLTNVLESREKRLDEWRYCNDPNTAPFERVEHAHRPVVYGVDLDVTGDESRRDTPSKAVYKLLLQDEKGNVFYGLEMDELPFLHPRTKTTQNPLPVPLGGTLVIEAGTTVSYGFALLRRMQCRYMLPDLGSPLALQLNDGVVQKYIEVLEQELREIRGQAVGHSRSR